MSLLTVAETALQLRLSRGMVYTLCQRGELRHERHGLRRGKILIPQDAIDEYRQAMTRPVQNRSAAPRDAGYQLKHLKLKPSPELPAGNCDRG